jgi:amino acid transporter
VIVSIVAGLVPIQVVGEMTSIGTLFAFVVVCMAVIVLRKTRPDAHRPFRVPGGATIPVLGVLSCLYLMVSLSVMTWVRLLVWLDIGMLIYWFYGRTHSPLADPREAAARTTGETVGNTFKITGYLLLFNGAAITLLAILTEWNVTNEALARWSELDALTSRVGIRVTPEIADRFGLNIMLIGAAVTVVGFLVSRAAGRPKAFTS